MKRLSILIIFGSACFAQDPAQQQDEVEKAHLSLLRPEVKKSAVAGRMTAELAGSLPKMGSDFQSTPVRNYIDQFLFARMQRDKVPHAPLSADEEFVRRAYLDATGRIPTPDELQTFAASKSPDKRDRLIDQITTSSAFVDKWTYYFEDLFRASGRMGAGLNLFHFWIREWLTLDRPYNELVTDLLTGAGKTSFSVPGGLYYARDFVKAKDDPTAPDAHDLVDQNDTIDEFTITYSKVFLGLNMACISCHDGARHLEKVNLYLTGKKREEFFGQAANRESIDSRLPVTAAHCSVILILPLQMAEKSRPCCSRNARRLVTNISRPKTIKAIQAVTPDSGFATRNKNAPQMMILSANGSRIRPSVVTKPYRRAMKPSSASVLGCRNSTPPSSPPANRAGGLTNVSACCPTTTLTARGWSNR